jgi:hypothetical protein
MLPCPVHIEDIWQRSELTCTRPAQVFSARADAPARDRIWRLRLGLPRPRSSGASRMVPTPTCFPRTFHAPKLCLSQLLAPDDMDRPDVAPRIEEWRWSLEWTHGHRIASPGKLTAMTICSMHCHGTSSSDKTRHGPTGWHLVVLQRQESHQCICCDVQDAHRKAPARVGFQRVRGLSPLPAAATQRGQRS